MKISKKSQYGLRGLFRLAKEKGHTPMKAVAEKEGISSDYLEKIFTELEKEGFIKSKRGPTGGYALALKPEEINLRMILDALENQFSLVECVEEDCERLSNCPVAPTWKKLDTEVKEKLELITIKTIIDNNK
ncbi:MAG: RrF2 family transcriptional regulator [Patescibacteria group bacterium]